MQPRKPPGPKKLKRWKQSPASLRPPARVVHASTSGPTMANFAFVCHHVWRMQAVWTNKNVQMCLHFLLKRKIVWGPNFGWYVQNIVCTNIKLRGTRGIKHVFHIKYILYKNLILYLFYRKYNTLLKIQNILHTRRKEFPHPTILGVTKYDVFLY